MKKRRVAASLLALSPLLIPVGLGFLVVAMFGGELTEEGDATAAAEADGVHEPARDTLYEVAQARGIRWELIGAVAWVMTDTGQDVPFDDDQRDIEQIMPVADPPIVVEEQGGPWLGPFLIHEDAVPSGVNPQSYRQSADLIAGWIIDGLEGTGYDEGTRFTEQRNQVLEALEELPVGWGVNDVPAPTADITPPPPPDPEPDPEPTPPPTPDPTPTPDPPPEPEPDPPPTNPCGGWSPGQVTCIRAPADGTSTILAAPVLAQADTDTDGSEGDAADPPVFQVPSSTARTRSPAAVFNRAMQWHTGEMCGNTASMSLVATNGPVNVGDTIAPEGRSWTLDITEQRMTHAQAIVQAGLEVGADEQALTIAMMTALQESTLDMHTQATSDRDSAGLFQQRPSVGWGTVQQIMNPMLSTQAFFGRATHTSNPGLFDITGWQQMDLGQAAQAVQRSAFPHAYTAWESDAAGLVLSILDAVGDGAATIQTSASSGQVGSSERCATPAGFEGPTQIVDMGGGLGQVTIATVTAPAGCQIEVNIEIADQVVQLLDAAAADGIELCGSGWRPVEDQIRLRQVNGCPDIWTASASSCRVPTAIPGTSQHNFGLAIDFSYDGQTICFPNATCPGYAPYDWLVANAPLYGMHKLNSEAWHYSPSGR